MQEKNTLSLMENLINVCLDVQVSCLSKPDEQATIFENFIPPDFIMEQIRIPIFQKIFGIMEPYVIYHIIDRFKLQYSVLCVDKDKQMYFLIGPYFTVEPSEEEMNDCIRANHLGSSMRRPLELYYSMLPIADPNKINPAMTIVAQHIWGQKEISYKRIVDKANESPIMVPPYTASHSDKIATNLLEQRCQMENLVLAAIEKGNRSEAVEARKNYCHYLNKNIMFCSKQLASIKNAALSNNTLYRKAAEKGAVHPFYIDTMHNRHCREIEAAACVQAIREIEFGMLVSYCDLVQKMSLRDYSPLVRQAINYMRINLNADLSLAAVAKEIKVSANYFSNIFNKEMQMNLTDFVNQIRIEEAARLFSVGENKVNSVAMSVGFQNVNYFSKVFRKIKNISPTEYIKQCKQKKAY